MKAIYDNGVGSLLKRKRKEKGLTLEQLGKMIGVNKGTISRWERNQINNMGIDKAKLLCEVLHLPPSIFIEGKDLNSTDFEEITPLEFKTEVIQRIQLVTNLTDKEKQKIISDIEFICDSKN